MISQRGSIHPFISFPKWAQRSQTLSCTWLYRGQSAMIGTSKLSVTARGQTGWLRFCCHRAPVISRHKHPFAAGQRYLANHQRRKMTLSTFLWRSLLALCEPYMFLHSNFACFCRPASYTIESCSKHEQRTTTPIRTHDRMRWSACRHPQRLPQSGFQHGF